MSIILCGISHKTAPVEIREKAIFSAEKIPFYLNDLLKNENVREAVLLSTCNRSELYCDADEVEKVIDWFCRQHQITQGELKSVLYIHQGQEAVTHMMQVACGLDSMVLGEPQILGQMKDAFSESCAAGSVGTLFNRLFQQIFAVAKEVRTNTAIGACPVSISSSAVNLVKQHFSGSINTATVLLLGAGDTIHLVLRYLKALLPKRVFIINRSFENARALAEEHRVEAIPFSELQHALQQTDLLFCATGSTQPVVTKSMLQPREKPIFIVDIAVPRDVDAAVSKLENIKLFSIDDLKSIIQQNLHGRGHAAEKAQEMIRQKSQEFIAWLNSLEEVTLTIGAYRKQIETLCHAELMKFRRQLQNGSDPAEVLTNFAHALTNKVLHHPSVQLRQAGFEGRFDLLELARQLFVIPEPKTELI
jgi:glutamyl-tRNA reductase